MPRLAERAVGTIGHLAPKAVDLLSTTGFAAAGVVSVVAENLRTLADRDEALPDRAKQVAQNSLGAVLAGPRALSDRGRSLVGRDEGPGGGSSRTSSGNGSRAHTAGDTSGSKSTAKTVAPDERPDRSKAEEARDREASDPSRVTADRQSGDRTARPSGGTTEPSPTTVGGDTGEKKPPRGIDTSSAEAGADTGKPASRKQDRQAGATKDAADQQKEQAKEAAKKAKDAAEEAAGKGATAAREKTERQAEKTAKKTAKRSGGGATAKADAKKADAEERDAATADDGNGQDRPRSVEEKRAAEKAAKKQQAERSGGNGQEDEQEKPDGLPAGVDDQLVADLQAMTVKQLRDRAAQDGVPGRSEMNKDELVVALATRETDDVPAKA